MSRYYITYVYEMAINNVYKKHEFYASPELALESAMDDIFENLKEGEWLTAPRLLALPLRADVWQVRVLNEQTCVHDYRIKIRRARVIHSANTITIG